MKRLALFFALTLAAASHAALTGPTAASIATQIEARLTALFQATDVLASDHAVLLATHYRRALAATVTPAARADLLAKLLERCNAPPPLQQPPGDLVRVPAPALVDDGAHDTLEEALRWAINATRKETRTVLPFGRRGVKRKDLLASLELFARLVATTPDSRELARKVAAQFDTYRSPGLAPSGDVLYTAYHAPIFDGRLKPDARYRWPVYAEPRTVGLANERYARADVARGALSGRGLELAYLADPMDAYLLEIEGSGLVQLPQGRCLKVEFAAKNGQPYKSLGKTMVRLGMITPWEMSIPAIRHAFAREPKRLRETLDTNPSQVYFKATLLDEVPRTLDYVPQRSVACDQTYFPRAGIGFALLERPDVKPDGEQVGWVPHHRYIINQDTGSAIRGAGHIDLYWGHDVTSGNVAGSTREPGALFYFLKRGTALVARR